MELDMTVVRGKLRRWEKFLYNFRLPAWGEIPNIGLYMDQMISLLNEYLDYMPPEVRNERVITRAIINNYVRLKIMPEPVKKRYYRIHIAYLIIICTLKQSLNIAMICRLFPVDMKEDELRNSYTAYTQYHREAAQRFTAEIRGQSKEILEGEDTEAAEKNAEKIIYLSAIAGGFSTLFSEKMILLENQHPDSPGMDLSIPMRRD